MSHKKQINAVQGKLSRAKGLFKKHKSRFLKITVDYMEEEIKDIQSRIDTLESESDTTFDERIENIEFSIELLTGNILDTSGKLHDSATASMPTLDIREEKERSRMIHKFANEYSMQDMRRASFAYQICSMSEADHFDVIALYNQDADESLPFVAEAYIRWADVSALAKVVSIYDQCVKKKERNARRRKKKQAVQNEKKKAENGFTIEFDN